MLAYTFLCCFQSLPPHLWLSAIFTHPGSIFSPLNKLVFFLITINMRVFNPRFNQPLSLLTLSIYHPISKISVGEMLEKSINLDLNLYTVLGQPK